MSVSKDVRSQADNLKEYYDDLSSFEALQIATRIVEIEAYKQAHAIDTEGGSSALEAIAICLGKDRQFSATIADAVFNVATAIEENKV